MADRVKHSLSTIKPQAVRSYASQYFSVDRMVQDYIGLYEEMIGEVSPVGTVRSGPQARGLSVRRS
jgi:hypothetical protein